MNAPSRLLFASVVYVRFRKEGRRRSVPKLEAAARLQAGENPAAGLAVNGGNPPRLKRSDGWTISK